MHFVSTSLSSFQPQWADNDGSFRLFWWLQYHDTETLVDGLENNTKRYIKIVSEAADAALPQPSRLDLEEDTFDILYKQVSCPCKDLCMTSQGLSDISQAADTSFGFLCAAIGEDAGVAGSRD